MISSQNYLYASVFFYFTCKFLSLYFYRSSMHNRKLTLTSIPEGNENEEDFLDKEWVPKNKHEVLKAKYKCLKKLFQIYDASVIGNFLEPFTGNGDGCSVDQQEDTKTQRKKRSHRTRTDASAGNAAITNESVIGQHREKESATFAIRELNNKCSSTFTETECKSTSSTEHTKDIFTSDKECGCSQTSVVNYDQESRKISEKRKQTRFKSFFKRILGIKRKRTHKNCVTEQTLTATENNLRYGKRKRRSLRIKILRKPKKILAEGTHRDSRSPLILEYVRSVQRNCLADRTPRLCPIIGCKMMLYGIINYNDHLNLCHFTERKFICHYCHEGHEREEDKFLHESEHLGITRLHHPVLCAPADENAQTNPKLTKDVQNEKLKVSFFDKIDPEQMYGELKNETDNSDDSNNSEAKQAGYINVCSRECLRRKGDGQCTHDGDVKCKFCGEHFDHRRQLCLHVDLKHRVRGKFSKFQSGAGVFDSPTTHTRHRGGSDTETNKTLSSATQHSHKTDSLRWDSSTNIVYSSTEAIAKKSALDSLGGKFKNGITSYKWEPGTRIVRV